VILSPSDDKSLDFTEKLVTSRQTLEDLKVDMQRLDDGVKEMNKHKVALLALQPQLQTAITREAEHNRRTGPQLLDLEKQKQADNQKTQAVMAQVKEVEAAIDKDLAAGLITKGDAATQRAALNQAQNSYTDSKISQVLLTDEVLEKNTTDTKSLDVLDKQAELISEIAQLDIAIGVAQKQVHEETQQIDRLKQALTTAKLTPYYLTVSGDSTVYFAFVPYDNRSNVSVGTGVYDCLLNMAVCKKVGTVKGIFTGEEHAIHPIFRTDIRGFLIQMQLSHPESAKSKTLFLNRKPLFF
jgi:ribosomal protein S20